MSAFFYLLNPEIHHRITKDHTDRNAASGHGESIEWSSNVMMHTYVSLWAFLSRNLPATLFAEAMDSVLRQLMTLPSKQCV